MVDHDHNRIEAIDRGKVSDEVHREVLERAGSLESKGGGGWDCRMGENFVHLANHTPANIFPDVGREAWPPVILRKEHNGLQVTAMAALEGAVGGGDQVMAGNLRDIEVGLAVKLPIVKGPVFGF